MLFGLAPMGDESSPTTEDLHMCVKFVLLQYEKRVENVVALVGNNEHQLGVQAYGWANLCRLSQLQVSPCCERRPGGVQYRHRKRA